MSRERNSRGMTRDDLQSDPLAFSRYSGVSNRGVDENGKFIINNVGPGHYRIVARSPDEYLYVKAITASAAPPARRGAARAANPAGGVSQKGFTFRLGGKMGGGIGAFAEGAAS